MIKYLESFNNLFDVLNSRNWNGKTYRMPLGQTTKEKYFQLLDEAEICIRGLQIDDPIINKKKKTIKAQRIPLIASKWRTGFVGFVVGIEGLRQMFKNHIDSNALKFLLTFKLSQDHLDTLFALIRSLGGCNDNPNCVQFNQTSNERNSYAQ